LYKVKSYFTIQLLYGRNERLIYTNSHTPSGLSFQVKIVWFNLTP
jgi:hypothetical protein